MNLRKGVDDKTPAFEFRGSGGTTALVTALRDSIGANTHQGSAYLFRNLDTATGTVIQNVKLTASDGAAGDQFGRGLSLSGDRS